MGFKSIPAGISKVDELNVKESLISFVGFINKTFGGLFQPKKSILLR